MNMRAANNDASSIIEMKKAKFLEAVKAERLTVVKDLLSNPTLNQELLLSMIYGYKDKNNKSALDYAVEKNNTELFVLLLSNLYSIDEAHFITRLKEIAKNKKSTPLHSAAQLGYAEFFKLHTQPTASVNDKKMWSIVYECWLNAVDQNGNTPLHLAMQYHPKANDQFIGAKRHTVANIIQIEELDLVVTNKKGQTALAEATQLGFYETTKTLLRIYQKNEIKLEEVSKEQLKEAHENEVLIEDLGIQKSEVQELGKENKSAKKESKQDKKAKPHKDKNQVRAPSTLQISKKLLLAKKDQEGHTPVKIASITGHQQIFDDIYYRLNPKQPKFKTDPTSLTMDILQNWAKNPNFSEEDFMKNLKAANSLSYKEVMSLIDLRMDSLKKNYSRKTLLSVIFGSLCPAITAATFLGTFGGLNPEPVTVALITAAAFPVLYVPFVYVGYKTRMSEYSNTAKEAMRFSWLATKLPMFENNFKDSLNALDKEATELNSKLAAIDTSKPSDELTYLQGQSEELQKRYKVLQDEMNDLITFTEEGKSKLALSYIPRQELKNKKRLGLMDPKENSAWTNAKDSLKAVVAYNTDIWCPLGAGLNIAVVATSLVLAKYGAVISGLTVAAGLAGPVGLVAVGVVSTVVLGCLIGAMIYKSSFQNEKHEMGTQNRSLVQAYNSCRIKTNMNSLRALSQRVGNKLEQIKNRVTESIRDIKSTEALSVSAQVDESIKVEPVEQKAEQPVKQKSSGYQSIKTWLEHHLFSSTRAKPMLPDETELKTVELNTAPASPARSL